MSLATGFFFVSLRHVIARPGLLAHDWGSLLCPHHRRGPLPVRWTKADHTDRYTAFSGSKATRSHPRSIPAPSIRAPSLDTGETTHVILVERYGGPHVLQLKEIALPPPAPDEVRIRHTAIGVNFIDVYCRTGFFDLLRIKR